MNITEQVEIMSGPEKRILSTLIPETPKLKYPLRALSMAVGPDALEYIIPEQDKQEVLNELYPFEDLPGINDFLHCLHEGERFRAGDFKVIRENNRNFLVSPFYARSGGMVIDWVPDQNTNMVGLKRRARFQVKEGVFDENVSVAVVTNSSSVEQ